MLKIVNWSIKNQGQDSLVLENINLTFKENEMVAIIGSSGVGKTTFLNSLAFNTSKVNGDLYFNDIKIDFNQRKELKKYRKNIGIISQKLTLINDLSVYDNLRYVMSERNNYFYNFFNLITKSQKEEIIQILTELGVIEKLFYKVKDLSGGESQRVEIAKLFIRKPKIILADEPTSNLDQTNSFNIIKMLKKLMNEQNAIALVNIHDVSQLKNNIDRVIAIKDKKILFDKAAKDVSLSALKDLYEKQPL